MKHLKFLLSAILLGAGLFTSCSTPKNLEYRGLENLGFRAGKSGGNRLVVDVRFYNPNNYKLQLKDGDISISINDKYLGRGSVDEKTVVPARESFVLPVALQTDINSLVGSALQLLANPEVTLKLSGSIKAGKGGVFITVPIDYITKQRIEIRN